MRYFLSPHRASCGFTLVEMIVVLVLVGIMAALGGMFIVRPIQGFLDLSRRARLVDGAETALRRMQRDVRQALPNSVRINGAGTALELLHTVDGGRYRAYGPGNDLDFTRIDADGFEVLGNLDTAPTAGQSIVVYNLTATGVSGNAYLGDNRTGIGAGSAVNSVNLDPPVQFSRSSPYQRFFIVDQPVSYVCDPAAGTLTRHAGYGISASQPSSPAGNSSLMASDVSACNFSYQPGTYQRAGLVTLQLQITESGETVTLLHQIHVENAP
ncbi:MAG: type II secretion system protein [Syntrophotaleaceae bacterium]